MIAKILSTLLAGFLFAGSTGLAQQEPPPELVSKIRETQALLGIELFIDAEKIMNAAVKDYPNQPGAWYMLGYTFHMQKKYDGALKAYDKVGELTNNRAPNSLYNMACIYAIKNDKDKAFEKLDLAVKAGFADLEHLQSDKDLTNLKEDPRFKNFKPTWSPNSDGFPFRAGEVQTVLDQIKAGTGGLNIDAKGRLYTADFGWRLDGRGRGGNLIWRVTEDGKSELFCESMKGASGNTFDKEGNLFQSSIGGNSISKIAPDGKAELFCTKGLRSPVGLAFNSKGMLFACNCGSNTIQQIDAKGLSNVFCQSELLNCPNGIAVGPDDTIYVCNFSNGDVLRIDAEGKASKMVTLPGNNNGHLVFHKEVLFVIARTGCRVFQVTLDGKAGVFAGSGTRGKEDGEPLKSSFSLPNSLIVSPDNKWLYVNETSPISGDPRVLGPTRIRKIELIANEQ